MENNSGAVAIHRVAESGMTSRGSEPVRLCLLNTFLMNNLGVCGGHCIGLMTHDTHLAARHRRAFVVSRSIPLLIP